MNPFEAILACLSGVTLGTFTGLVPGIHINTVSFLLLMQPLNSSMFFVLLISSMAVTHTFVDSIPSIILGAPDSDNFLSLLAGHRLLLKGQGFFAVKLTLFGSILGLVASLLFIPFFVSIVATNAGFLSSAIPYLLIIVLVMMLFSAASKEKFFWSATIIILSGSIGLVSLNSFPNSIFPLATGFFGGAAILYSLTKDTKSVAQKFSVDKYDSSDIVNSFFGVLAGSFVSVVPALGASNAAFIIRKFLRRIRNSSYLVMLGSINTSAMLFSFVTLWLLGKTRTGTAIAIKNLINLDFDSLLLILAACLFAGSLAFFIAEAISKVLLKKVTLFNYSFLNIIVFVFLVAVTLLSTNLEGLLLFLTASSIGMIANSSHTRRSNCMAFLIVPVLFFYFS